VALQWTSTAFRQAAEKVAPALVTIESFGGVSAVAGKIGGIRKQGDGNATGLVLTPDGYVVTSTFSFIERPPVITVITSDGQRHVARMLGQDHTRKLCLLKIDGVADLPVATTVNQDSLRVGQWTISVGVGFGDSNPAISAGILSAKNRVGGRALQTDTNTSPACYGGPLIDLQGRVMGICVPLNPQSSAIGAGVEWYDSGIGFAVPIEGLDKVWERLKRGENIHPAFLGVQAAANRQGPGLRIATVVPESSAAQAGLAAEDVLLEVNGAPLSDLTELKLQISRFEAGQTADFLVQSPLDEAPRILSVTLGQPPADPAQSQIEPPKIR
jgi:serine protease Do